MVENFSKMWCGFAMLGKLRDISVTKKMLFFGSDEFQPISFNYIQTLYFKKKPDEVLKVSYF